MLSDNCCLSWGKCKLFMFGGVVVIIILLMFFVWIKDIVGGFFGVFGVDLELVFVKNFIIVIVVLWVYILDFVINIGRLLYRIG